MSKERAFPELCPLMSALGQLKTPKHLCYNEGGYHFVVETSFMKQTRQAIRSELRPGVRPGKRREMPVRLTLRACGQIDREPIGRMETPRKLSIFPSSPGSEWNRHVGQ